MLYWSKELPPPPPHPPPPNPPPHQPSHTNTADQAKQWELLQADASFKEPAKTKELKIKTSTESFPDWIPLVTWVTQTGREPALTILGDYTVFVTKGEGTKKNQDAREETLE